MLRRMREVGGLVLMGIGVVGILMPGLPGTVFLLAGTALLGPDHPKVRAWLKRLERWRKAGKGVPRETGHG